MPTMALQLAASDPAATTVRLVVLPYIGVFFAALAVSLAVTPIMRKLALNNGIVDWPDLKRKNHARPVAYLGGVAIFLGWLAGITVCLFTTPHNNGMTHSSQTGVSFPLSIIIGAAVITLTGLFDDVYGISPRVKIGGQLFAAAALACESVGIHLASSFLTLLHLHPAEPLVYLLGTFFIAFFVIGGCNSMNLLDGLDGLAAGVAGIAALGFLVLAAILAVRPDAPDAMLSILVDPVRLVMALAILGAVVGFLPYNFNPASIFMGDAGSLLLGYLCVADILLFAEVGDSSGPKLVTAGLIIFILPITDTSLAILRRKLRGRPIFSPDNEHLHHLLRRSGLSVRQSVVTVYAAGLLFALLGCALVTLNVQWRYLLATFAVIYLGIMLTAYLYGRHLLTRPAAAPKPAADATTAGAEPRGKGLGSRV